jgi:uncharacterized repeat protein (TIGR03803 family)
MKVHRSVRLELEILEEKVLLSSGIGKPAAAAVIMASKTPKPFNFNGKLPLKLTAAFDQAIGENVFTEVAPRFREKKPFTPMGNGVKVTGALAQPGVASADGLPSLSGSAFRLSSTKGSLVVTFSASTTDTYSFSISGGTKQLVKADGTTGTAVLSVAPKTGFSLTFKSNKLTGQSTNPPLSGQLITLASFDGSGSGTNGENPNAGVTLDSQGDLFGTTSLGGADNFGTVWEIAKGSGTLTVIASFNTADGAVPDGGVTLDADGNLYGTTTAGGTNSEGTVWEIAKGTNTIITLASFSGPLAVKPLGNVTLDAQGDIIGTTYLGGPAEQGTIWEIVKESNTITTIASFNGVNGGLPLGGVIIDAQGNLYGTTDTGGAHNEGTIWEVAKGTDTITALYPQGGSGPPLRDAQGNFYTVGSANHEILLDEVSKLANGMYAISRFFVIGAINTSSLGGVFMDAQGDLFGTEGTEGEGGAIWELVNGASTITTIATFGGTDGKELVAGVTMDAAGNLFGTTYSGGASGFGTVWEFIVGAVQEG